MELKSYIYQICRKAKDASYKMAGLNGGVKKNCIAKMSKAILDNKEAILKANKKDLLNAVKMKRSKPIIDRLMLDEKRIKSMSDTLKEVSEYSDPVGAIEEMRKRPNGLMIGKMRVPIGVVGIIYEARPNVTADCIGLCLLSGNSVILRGGSEAIHSNKAIYECLRKVVKDAGLPQNALNFIENTDRKSVSIMLKMSDYIDLIIPRGGASLIKEVSEKATMAVIKHYKGVCHVYVDEFADLNMAEKICYNAKVQRPSVCNAVETLLVHKDVACRFLPSAIKMLKAAGVQIRGCKKTKHIVKDIKKADEKDWYEEYLDLILSVKVVNSLDEAIKHILKYGSNHSDAIVTENYDKGMEFISRVDSSCVYINASTRFTDGNQFGMGAEIGISTDKIHARGPMGAKELTTYKYVIFGNGQIREK